MRKLFLFAATALVMSTLSSCQEEACKINNTGDVKITNGTDETLWFDVTGEDGKTSGNKSLTPSASTTYTMPVGTIKIWASWTEEDEDFELVDVQEISQCEVINYELTTLPTLSECRENNTGDVTITNNTDMYLYFDVTGEDGNTTENRLVHAGKSTTYTIPAGTAKIWASYTEKNEDFMLVSTQDLAQCDEIDYQTPSQTCGLFNFTEVKIINKTGGILWVDILQGEHRYGKKALSNYGDITYSKVDVSEKILIGGSYDGKDDWQWTDPYTITACEPFEFTWNHSKFQAAKEASKTQLPIEVSYKVRETKK